MDIQMPTKLPMTPSDIPIVDLDKIDFNNKPHFEQRLQMFNERYTDDNKNFRIIFDHVPFIFYWQKYKMHPDIQITLRKYFYDS